MLFLISYSYFYTGGGHNEAARFDTIRALLRNHTFIVDPYAYNSADLIQVAGHYYSSKAPGTTFLGLPFFWFFEHLFKLTSWPEFVQDHWTCFMTSIFTIALPCALGMMVLYWLLLKLRATPREATTVTLAIGIATIYFPFATLFFSHAATAAFVLIGFYQIFSFEKERWRLIVAGLSLGTAIMFEFPAAIAVAFINVYAIWIFWRKGKRLSDWSVLIAATLVALLPLFIQNAIAFGNPFFISYEAYAQSSNTAFEAHKHGILGIRIPLFNPDDWALFLHNFAEITYRPLRGLFFFNPVLLLALPGTFILIRNVIRKQYPFPAEALLAAALFFAYICFDAGFGDSIVYWGGGASFGPRHVLPMIPFLALPLLESLRNRWVQPAFMLLLFVSIFFCLMATAVEPRTPYEPHNPIFFYYLPRFLAGDLAITNVGVFSNQFITPDSVAFNWGKIAGLPGRWQLIPLYIFWIIGARELDRQIGIKARGFTYAAGILVAILALLPILAAP